MEVKNNILEEYNKGNVYRKLSKQFNVQKVYISIQLTNGERKPGCKLTKIQCPKKKKFMIFLIRNYLKDQTHCVGKEYKKY